MENAGDDDDSDDGDDSDDDDDLDVNYGDNDAGANHNDDGGAYVLFYDTGGDSNDYHGYW